MTCTAMMQGGGREGTGLSGTVTGTGLDWGLVGLGLSHPTIQPRPYPSLRLSLPSLRSDCRTVGLVGLDETVTAPGLDAAADSVASVFAGSSPSHH